MHQIASPRPDFTSPGDPPGTSGSTLIAVEGAIEAEARTLLRVLGREAGLDEGAGAEAAAEAHMEAWSGILAMMDLPDLGALPRRASLRAAAESMRRHGVPRAGGGEPTPIPEGLTPEALRGGQMEVIPGRRSVVGLHLRGYSMEEMGPLYGLDLPTMEDRLDQALENFRSSLHRRAERMNQEPWSRGI